MSAATSPRPMPRALRRRTRRSMGELLEREAEATSSAGRIEGATGRRPEARSSAWRWFSAAFTSFSAVSTGWCGFTRTSGFARRRAGAGPRRTSGPRRARSPSRAPAPPRPSVSGGELGRAPCAAARPRSRAWVGSGQRASSRRPAAVRLSSTRRASSRDGRAGHELAVGQAPDHDRHRALIGERPLGEVVQRRGPLAARAPAARRAALR